MLDRDNFDFEMCREQLSELYTRPGFKIRRVHQISVAIFLEANSELNLTPSQFGVLCALANDSDLDQNGVSYLVKLDRSTTALVLTGLEKRGMIKRVIHSTDRRKRALSLTSEGLKLFRRSRKPAALAIERVMGALDGADRLRFTTLLEQLVAAHTTEADSTREGALPELHRRPGFLIRRMHQFSVALFIEECRAFELTPTQFGVLFALSRCSGMDQISLARLMSFDRSTTGMVVKHLEKRGTVGRSIDVNDRRRRLLSLQPFGRQLVRDAAPLAHLALDRLVHVLCSRDREFLLDALEKIIKASAAMAPEVL